MRKICKQYQNKKEKYKNDMIKNDLVTNKKLAFCFGKSKLPTVYS